MNEERMKILKMLEEGKITAEQAQNLMSALDESDSRPSSTTHAVSTKKLAQFLRIQVEPKSGEGDSVNIRVPFQILRSGVKLASLMPEKHQASVSHALREKGIDFDFSKAKAEGLDELIEQLSGITVDVDGRNETVRIFCE